MELKDTSLFRAVSGAMPHDPRFGAGSMPFGACGDNAESKIRGRPARVGLCAGVEDGLPFRGSGATRAVSRISLGASALMT